MIPIRYEQEENKVKFFYKQEDYNYWKEFGLSEGTTGCILVGQEGELNHYKCFGTFENPNRSMFKVITSHCEVWDGKRSTPEEICNYKPEYNSVSHRIVVLDFNDVKPVKLKLWDI